MYASAPSTELAWEKYYPSHISWDHPLTPKPLYSFLDESVRKFPDRPAVDFMGRKFSYAEIGDLVERAAEGFRQLGVRKGARVGICLPNCPYQVVSFYAILKAGGVVVNFNPLYTPRELASQARDAGVDIMVTIDVEAVYPKVRELLNDATLKRVVVVRMQDCLSSFKGMLFSAFKRKEISHIPNDMQHVPFSKLISYGKLEHLEPVVPEHDLAVLQYTGGTTGLPKGAMLTHGNLAANTQQIMAWMPDLREGEEKILGVLPFFHVFAMSVVLNLGVAVGAEMILLPRFELDQVLKTLHKKRPTLFPGVPTIYTAINGAKDLKKYDLSSISYCISGGAPLPVEVKREFERLTGCVLVEGYGLTEASPVLTCNPLNNRSADKAGAIGLPVPGTRIEMRSLEDPAQVVRVGEKGELCARGPQVMRGYWERPEENERVFVDGWLRTADVGYMDEDGYIFLVDRIKDMILCSGFNVYPRVIEEAIYLHPAVAQVAVIGVPDSYRGESPKAFIKLREGASVTEKELTDFLEEKISRIEMPRFFEFRSELPVTMIGKLSKKALQEEEEAKRASGEAVTKASA